MGTKEGMGWNEHWAFYATDDSLNSTSETSHNRKKNQIPGGGLPLAWLCAHLPPRRAGDCFLTAPAHVGPQMAAPSSQTVPPGLCLRPWMLPGGFCFPSLLLLQLLHHERPSKSSVPYVWQAGSDARNPRTTTGRTHEPRFLSPVIRTD